MTQKNTSHAWYFTLFAWSVAVVATLGSLFFSEVMDYPPCILCWYQRIAMYPLVVILLVGLLSPDGSTVKYAAPLAVIGGGIATFHNLLYYELIPESTVPCAQGISCTTAHIEWLGFVTIPLLSLIAFLLVLGLLYFMRIFADEN